MDENVSNFRHFIGCSKIQTNLFVPQVSEQSMYDILNSKPDPPRKRKYTQFYSKALHFKTKNTQKRVAPSLPDPLQQQNEIDSVVAKEQLSTNTSPIRLSPHKDTSTNFCPVLLDVIVNALSLFDTVSKFVVGLSVLFRELINSTFMHKLPIDLKMKFFEV